MRTFASFIAILAFILVVVQAQTNVRELVSSILADRPKEIQSALESQISSYTTITGTEASVLSSVASELNEAVSSAVSVLSSAITSVPVPTSSVIDIVNAASVSSSNNSLFAVATAFLLSVFLFQAL